MSPNFTFGQSIPFPFVASIVGAVDVPPIFTGSQANKLKLIDQIGDRADAIEWLKSKESLGNLEVKDYALVKPASKLERLMEYTDNIKLIFSTIFSKMLP